MASTLTTCDLLEEVNFQHKIKALYAEKHYMQIGHTIGKNFINCVRNTI
nr:hypothetical protein [Wolbachia endosymbiont (group B) of Athalia cordata]